jgi:hypothetical protein
MNRELQKAISMVRKRLSQRRVEIGTNGGYGRGC